MKNMQGFTLIEVLIALTIIALSLFAALKVTAQSVKEVTQVREKLAAHWTAMNVLAECQVGLLSFDQVNSHEGETQMLGYHFTWQAKRPSVSPNDVQFPLTIQVKNHGKTITQLSGRC